MGRCSANASSDSHFTAWRSRSRNTSASIIPSGGPAISSGRAPNRIFRISVILARKVSCIAIRSQLEMYGLPISSVSFRIVSLNSRSIFCGNINSQSINRIKSITSQRISLRSRSRLNNSNLAFIRAFGDRRVSIAFRCASVTMANGLSLRRSRFSSSTKSRSLTAWRGASSSRLPFIGDEKLDTVQLAHVNRQEAVIRGAVEDVGESGVPDHFFGHVRRARVDCLREGLVEAGEQDQKLASGLAQVFSRHAV